MPALANELRNKLERTIIDARDIAEVGARAALEALAVHHHEPYSHMKPPQRELRNHLRARARQLGDRQDGSGRLTIDHLAGECAYEHWHRMLFARFLAENGLLIEPEMGVAISLAEAEELAKEDGVDVWVFTSRCAQRMLPQIFRPEDPLLQVSFASEHMLQLERLLASLPQEVFTASDALGWVYQFWQSKKKNEVNRSEVKIGADEISAVTQLFTEPYMVEFLLHNTLGAWWAGKVAAASSRWSSFTTEAEARQACALPGLTWDYLRFIRVEAASSRLNEEQRQDAAATIGFYRKNEPIGNLSGVLPHWRQDSVTYFVTFRTADSLPQERLQQWLTEKEQWLQAHPEPRDADAMQEYYERFPERIEHWLDQGHGACHLKEPAIRQIMQDALKHFDGQRYTLDECAIAGNHVHVLVTPKDRHELSDILHSWKSFTANAINKHLGQSGAFWQKESFDHIVRNPAQLERIRAYVREHEEKRQDAASTLHPAAGTFEGWPKTAAELKVLDPCCGSGHFLVAALHHLVPIRMAEEGLTAADAVDAVLRDNLHGLEIDDRCCQIAAFALAFAAWTYPNLPSPSGRGAGGEGALGYRDLPELHIACTGIGPQCSADQWVKLAEESGISMPVLGREPIKDGLRNLHRLFSQAPTLGSLIDPSELPADLITADYETIQPYLTSVLKAENADDDMRERATAAAGMVKAADLLANEYTLVVTNVPYLGRNRQDSLLRGYLELQLQEGKADLASAFVIRCLDLCQSGGTASMVTPQSWLFQTTYTQLRRRLLARQTWNIIARLGAGAFETISGHVVNVALVALSIVIPNERTRMGSIDASTADKPSDKATALRGQHLGNKMCIVQLDQLKNPDACISHSGIGKGQLLSDFASNHQGLSTGDNGRFRRCFWEVCSLGSVWEPEQSTVNVTVPFGGRSGIVKWEGGAGELYHFGRENAAALHNVDRRGEEAWGKCGVAISQTGNLPSTLYFGQKFDTNAAVLVPIEARNLCAMWAYCSSREYVAAVRTFDHALKVTNANLTKIPFDLPRWQQVAAEHYPDGLPEPESDDPTQWLFHGHPHEADEDAMLQVAVARLMGYRWPAEHPHPGPLPGGEGQKPMRLSKRARALVAKCGELAKFADNDGIVCIPSVRGEDPAADRLLKLLEACGGSGILPLLPAAGSRSHLDLDDWLRNDFFEEHCKLFHDRPFVWHIWDGRKRDGFHALINYHKLCGASSPSPSGRGQGEGAQGRKLLESLTYSYLGEWITRQKDGVKRGEGGAEDRLAAALELQKRLEAILTGEPPFDIFVRWKSLSEQPIGWEPDINDGVRLNIRPFLASDLPGGKKGAGILRHKPNVKWKKDRGKEPERPKDEYPWFWGWDERTEDFTGGKSFDGNRWNDLHYTNKFKQAARDAAGKGKS